MPLPAQWARPEDFATLFQYFWHRDFPIDKEAIGARRADWTIHIGIVVRNIADLMGLYARFEAGSRKDAVLRAWSGDEIAVEWEWGGVWGNELSKLQDPRKVWKRSKDAAKQLKYAVLITYTHNARFFGYLQSYDSLLGLEAATEALAKEVNALTEKRDSLTRLAEKCGLTPDDVAEGIAALKALRKKGVAPSAISSYQRVLTAAGTHPGSFEKLVAEVGGLQQAVAAVRKALEKRDQELQAKRRAVEELKKEEARVKESIATLCDTLRPITAAHIAGHTDLDGDN